MKNLLDLVEITVCSYHATYTFRVDLHSGVTWNVKELLARKRHGIWRLSDCSGTRTHNQLVRYLTISHWDVAVTCRDNFGSGILLKKKLEILTQVICWWKNKCQHHIFSFVSIFSFVGIFKDFCFGFELLLNTVSLNVV